MTRLPAAIKWLAIGLGGWLIWRAPIALSDFSHFKAAATLARIEDRVAVTRRAAPRGEYLDHASQASADGAAIDRPARRNPAIVRTGYFATDQAVTLDLPPATASVPRTAPGDQPGRQSTGSTLAEAGYQRLREGRRQEAAALLAQAVAFANDDPRAASWAADRRQLLRHWHGDAYLVVRDGGPAAKIRLVPSLGGSQMSARLAYVLNPLSDQRVTIAGRIYQPFGRKSGGSDAAQSVAAVEVQPMQGLPLTLALERYVAAGHRARNAWSLRASGGTNDIPLTGGLTASAYAQAGVIGIRSRDGYAEGAVRLNAPPVSAGPLRIQPHVGTWAAAQPGAARVDIGPGLEVEGRAGRAVMAGSIDYRVRVAGNARPGNGPALTVRAGF